MQETLQNLKNQSKTILNQESKKINEISFEFDSVVNLFICWYGENNSERLKEYEYCLNNNFLNSHITNIYVLCEHSSPLNIDKYSNKFKFISVNERLKYKDIFEIINSVSGDSDINILANTDIYFDDTIRFIEPTLDNKTVYCLTRWNVLTNGELQFHNRKDSQDVWAFRGKISKFQGGNFYMGVAGCDNKIAHEFHTSGYKLLNPSLSIKSMHLHNTGVRNYVNKGIVQRVPPPYQLVTPSLLGNFRIHKRIKAVGEKSILHIGLNTEYQKTLVKALSTLGNYFLIDWRNELEYGNLQMLYRKILETINEYDIDLIFMQIQRPDIITKELIQHINIIAPEIKIINWCGDIRDETPKWMIDLASFNNIYTSFTNYRDVNTLLNLGYSNSFYMPMSFEEGIFNVAESKRIHMPSIVFIGTNYGDRFELTELRKNVIAKMKFRYVDKFQVYGTGWDTILNGVKHIPKSYSTHIYRGAKIALSINNINAYKYTSDRLFNIMASRCFCLAHYYEGIEEQFKQGYHLDWWHDLDELDKKVDYYLNHAKERRQIAQQGYDEIWKNHRWINRIEIIKQKVLNQ